MISADSIQDTPTVERRYLATVPVAHRKQYGQFFTPVPVADLMARWVTAAQPGQILDPAIGTGILAQAAQRHAPQSHITGIDIDPLILSWVAYQPDLASATLQQHDFLTYDWTARFDGVIANPPYLKFHDYDNKKAVEQVQQHVDVKLSGFTNLYALFLLKAITHLAEGGRAAFLIPSEFLNADYGVPIKEFLLRQGCLRHVLIVHFGQMLFEDALTTACVLLLEKAPPTNPVFFVDIQSADQLLHWEHDLNAALAWPACQLDASVKWRSYYQPVAQTEYRHLVPFNTVGKVVRGIATGANDYFVFSPSKARQWTIPNRNLLPCIARSADVKTSFFTDETFQRLHKADKSVYLFNGLPSPDEAVTRYLRKGEQEGVHEKFLTACRKPWYSIENRPPAPIWVTVFNRNGLRFIRNETQTRNLTTFHCVYLSMFYESKTDLVMAYLLTDVAKEIFNDNRREYGNGLQKFEPNDINKAMMLDLSQLNQLVENAIVSLYQQYRQSDLADSPDESLRLQIDELFREFYTL